MLSRKITLFWARCLPVNTHLSPPKQKNHVAQGTGVLAKVSFLSLVLRMPEWPSFLLNAEQQKHCFQSPISHVVPGSCSSSGGVSGYPKPIEDLSMNLLPRHTGTPLNYFSVYAPFFRERADKEWSKRGGFLQNPSPEHPNSTRLSSPSLWTFSILA